MAFKPKESVVIQKPFVIDLNKYSQEEALGLAEKLHGAPGVWGVRLNSVLGSGPRSVPKFIRALRDTGLGVFADLRLSHTPAGNAEWVKLLGGAGASWISVNPYEGYQALEEAVKASGAGTVVLADVSLPNCDLRERLYGCSATELLNRVFKETGKAKVGGYVCYDSSSSGLCEDERLAERVVVRTIWQAKLDYRVIELLRAGFGHLCFCIPDQFKAEPAPHLEELLHKVSSAKSAA